MISVRRLLRQQDGATAIEYALLAGMIALAIIAIVTTMGGNLATLYGNVNNGFTN